MTKAQIETQILEHVSQHKSFTMYLLKQEFPKRYHNEVRDAVLRLRDAGKLHIDSNMFIKFGPA